ncbi:MAG TPA: asparagine synthase (glutamine-hydrolyzing) [Thermoanaerobaculia bacterium]|nr:asparagine synthase (glutamine-hydrolyzing) [Thermoanaerobaculia bacterium]
MATRLTHRGPDSSGVYSNDHGLSLGFRRLAIVDLSEAGAQPMHSKSGRYVLTFNGEIFNFERLRARLPRQSWRGHSDTEVLLACVEEWGLEQAVSESIGMFAFALWDTHEQTLSLVRDRVGVKPLYYALTPHGVQWASELDALDVERVIDPEAAALYARYRYVPAPWSIVQGVKKLMPGTILTIGRHSTNETRYWDPVLVAERSAANRFHGSEDDALQALDDLLGDSVALRMIADVPLGVFLSGGVDSSLIAALMQCHASGPIHTFTIGFEDRRFDESPYGREVARHLGSRHDEMIVSIDEALRLVPQLPEIYDEPFADSSALPTWLVSRLARQSATVALSGDGGDELFAGYHHHFLGRRLQRRVRAVPRFARGTTGRVLRALQRTRSLGQALVEDDPIATYQRSMLLDLNRVAPLARPLPRLDDPTERVMFLDFTTYLPDDILVKVDRASMAVSLEARTPFLDHRVVELAWSLPLSLKIRDDRGKWILRRLLRRYLPDALVDREKQGFGLPLAAWLREPLRDWAESLLTDVGEPFDAARIRELWRAHLAGANHEGALWTVLMYQAWLGGLKPALRRAHLAR